MKKRTSKRQTATKKSITPKLQILKRHAVGVDSPSVQVNSESPDNFSASRYTVVPVIKKRFIKKHAAKN